MDISECIVRISELNCSAMFKVSAEEYDSALADLADAYSLERMVISQVLLLRRALASAESSTKEKPGGP